MADDVRERIRNHIVSRMLRGDGRGLEYDTDLLGTGVMDSFAALDVVQYLQEEFSVRIELNQMTATNLRSVDSLANLVANAPHAG